MYSDLMIEMLASTELSGAVIANPVVPSSASGEHAHAVLLLAKRLPARATVES